ncbi:MAG: histidine-type phosphatase [Salinivirgaceae bacterium]|nr:histidine-type phosphatase [Salinivirgaceae bacterium]
MKIKTSALLIALATLASCAQNQQSTKQCTLKTEASDSILTKYTKLTYTNHIYYDTAVMICNEIDNGVFDYPTLTAAPKGYKPFYISHYGRHGSRYHWGQREYQWWAATLDSAKNEGMLNEQGLKIANELALINADAKLRAGDLSAAGRTQHQGIAQRMMKNFPQVFEGPNAYIDAKSTVVTRCILSMDAFCQELKAKYPTLTISNDCGLCFQYYLLHEPDRNPYRDSAEWRAQSFKFYGSLSRELPAKRLFIDAEAAAKRFNLHRIASGIYNAAGIGQGVFVDGVSEIFNFFTPAELIDQYKSSNFYWYTNYSCAPQLGGLKNVKNAQYLANKIIEEADAVINGTSNLRANLRFGHDNGLMPLLALLGVNKAGEQIDDLSQLANKWTTARYVPMAANMQIIFYRSSNANDDILVKILQNENEAQLPIDGNFPYYKWNDVKAFWLQQIETANK